MHKRQLHHWLVRLRPMSYWYFAALFVVSGITGLLAMRQNNLTALNLRDKVLQVDKDNGDVEAALRELREFTYSHMNARLASDTGIYPPIQLTHRYDRLVAAEKARVQSANQDLYAQAQQVCEARIPQGLFGANRIPCIQNYIDTNGGPEAKEQPIPDGLYKFDFVSPAWSPDLAGWSLVACALAALLFVTRLGLELWLKSQLD